MLKERARSFVEEIFALYPSVPLRPGSEHTYVRYLAELDEGQVAAVLPDLLRTSQTMPTVADVRRRIAEQELGLPAPIEAYNSLFGPGSERHPLTNYVADTLGGIHTIRHSELPGAIRSQFLTYFAEMRDQAVRHGKLPRSVLRAVELREAGAQEAPRQPSVWLTIKGRFEALPEPEQQKRLKEARQRLLSSGETSPQWLAAPVVEHEALRQYATENGWIEQAS